MTILDAARGGITYALMGLALWFVVVAVCLIVWTAALHGAPVRTALRLALIYWTESAVVVGLAAFVVGVRRSLHAARSRTEATH
jgi:hypothetical protein